MKKQFLSFFGFLFLSIFIFGCGGEGRNKGDVNIYSVNQDAKLGAHWAAQVQQMMPILFDEKLMDYVNGIGQKLITTFPDRMFDYHFKIVKDPQINAFALPGGYIFVNLGLLQVVDEEAELAMVLGHESGHVVFRHGTEQLTKAQGFSCCLAIGAAAVGLGQTEVDVINLFGETGLLFYGRKAELEADRFGVEALYNANYDFSFAHTFFEKLLKIEKRQPTLMEKLLSTHPPTKDRIAQAIAETKKYTQKPNPVKSTPSFQEMKKILEKYPNKYKVSELKKQYRAYLARHEMNE
ncbi:MAG: hypothetical protein A2Z91_04675 [Deltaproteobacteria bacterium GWA2_38_16]|nr:MAG: hypothetical protein A2Z91_04675 [Deltaproteobacteria bacterium GWA2_38_16]OGQ01703.1 MAG: hypothetical protein A3D19_07505 [Deltaproteobacteria bacterium RIFCSPHIGHO2_02_FULL_38_15]HBQ21799.1 hypothetical protein [Deltaproteobacteria bacterium]